MSAADYAPRILSTEQIFSGFDAVAPMVKASEEEWNKTLAPLFQSDRDKKIAAAIAFAQLYFSLGVRWREHIANHEAHAQLLDAAADPDSPTIAIPGVDFSTDQFIADLKKNGKL